MNSVAFAQRLGRNLDVDDPALLPADAALDVLAAANAGIQLFYQLAPDRLKRTTISATIRPPENVSVSFAVQYSNQLATGSFSGPMIGCSVRFANGSSNEVVNESSTLDDWMGSDLATTGTVYFDAIQIPQVIERISGPVRVFPVSGHMLGVLLRDDTIRDRHHRFGPGFCWENGRPHRYAMDMVGQSQGARPAALLRVRPLPDEPYILRFEADLAPAQIGFPDLTNAVAMPVPVEHIQSILIPLCEAELVSSPFWRDPATKTQVLAKAESVKAERLRRIAPDMAPLMARVGTPRGF